MSHKCHAIGCDTPCKPEYLMCPRHWKMLPKSRQRSVLREYRAGQCQLDPVPSPQWHDAADAAIYWVRIAELQAELSALRNPWVSVEERLPDDNREVEIAFWDGTYFCRIHGGYDDGEWYIGPTPWDKGDAWGGDFPIMYWKEATPLPEQDKL